MNNSMGWQMIFMGELVGIKSQVVLPQFHCTDTNPAMPHWTANSSIFADVLWNLWGLRASTTCLSIRLSVIAKPSLEAPQGASFAFLFFLPVFFFFLFQRHSHSFRSPAINTNCLMKVIQRWFRVLVRIKECPQAFHSQLPLSPQNYPQSWNNCF